MGERFPVTIFRDIKARTKTEREFSVGELAELIRATAAAEKHGLPLLKLASFGDKRTEKGSLRFDDNMVRVFGAESDYDGGAMSFEDAVARAREAGVSTILYTSPSHTPEKPRWRGLFPFAGAMLPAGRALMADRANAIFGGVLSRETWALSQAYFFGRVYGRKFRLEVIEGEPIDVRSDLKGTIQISKPPEIVGTAARCEFLSDYGAAALRSAAEAILAAPRGRQESTLNREAYGIGRCAGSGGVPVELALRVLLTAAEGMPNHDSRRPWRAGEAAAKARRAFQQGLARPRPSRAQIEREFDRALAEAAENWDPADG
jgi:hypothetical protein